MIPSVNSPRVGKSRLPLPSPPHPKSRHPEVVGESQGRGHWFGKPPGASVRAPVLENRKLPLGASQVLLGAPCREQLGVGVDRMQAPDG